MNFNIPKTLKHDLDMLARYKHVSRTSILNSLLTHYCREELKQLEDCNRFRSLVQSMSIPVAKVEREVEYEEPIGPMFDDEIDSVDQFSSFFEV